MELSIQTTPSPETYGIVVSGEIDISNADQLRNAINLALEQPTDRVELNFSGVSYIDSTGIGVLVGAAHHAEERARGFAIVHAQANVARVAQLLGVADEIGISAE
ncbi:STAS domain-containing protein [Collinsella sp. zg1085]|uniref:STAS domain-containing protein n=1 Tax=Collinsella sp. zg1085 TaxID=2844380 RepID=UPI001C0B8F9B|nr:STAS domain-containing protein [Collinsella sp. zg1085]QWT17382.1 STAS domain-containing protein [Collinsella sp. zg1085]